MPVWCSNVPSSRTFVSGFFNFLYRHIFLFLSLVLILLSKSIQAGIDLAQIKLPPGFSISLFADKVDNARSMQWNGKSILYVGSRGAGNVYALVDKDGDYRADEKYIIARNLRMPNGIAYRNGDLYVAEIHRVLLFKDIDKNYQRTPRPDVIFADLPQHTHHGWRYIAFGPDGKLYIPIGAPCNICDEPGYAVITRLNADGSGHEVYVRGVRNSVGFDWHPRSKQLWFTDNGRDGLGDDLPPDELNRVTAPGQHFGYPYCHGGFLLDPEFGKGRNCVSYIAPVQNLGAHVASLGMHFYTGKQFPKKYLQQIFIAEHGSWDRSKKIGYRITLVRLQDNRAVAYETFASGWLQGEKSWGRPVDIKPLPDGSLLVSDDAADAIYRISYQP